jgi:hypothetical protein
MLRQIWPRTPSVGEMIAVPQSVWREGHDNFRIGSLEQGQHSLGIDS